MRDLLSVLLFDNWSYLHFITWNVIYTHITSCQCRLGCDYFFVPLVLMLLFVQHGEFWILFSDGCHGLFLSYMTTSSSEKILYYFRIVSQHSYFARTVSVTSPVTFWMELLNVCYTYMLICTISGTNVFSPRSLLRLIFCDENLDADKSLIICMLFAAVPWELSYLFILHSRPLRQRIKMSNINGFYTGLVSDGIQIFCLQILSNKVVKTCTVIVKTFILQYFKNHEGGLFFNMHTGPNEV